MIAKLIKNEIERLKETFKIYMDKRITLPLKICEKYESTLNLKETKRKPNLTKARLKLQAKRLDLLSGSPWPYKCLMCNLLGIN